MNIRHILGMILGLLLFIPAQAQFNFASRAVPAFGFTTNLVTAQSAFSNRAEGLHNFYNLFIDNYTVLAQKNDFVSVGVDAGLGFGVSLAQANNLQLFVNYAVQVPVHLMARVGANSTPYNTQTFGLGAGIGFTGSHFAATRIGNNLRDRALYYNPSAILEASYGRTIFRIGVDIFKPQANLIQRNVISGVDAPSASAFLGFIHYGLMVAL